MTPAAATLAKRADDVARRDRRQAALRSVRVPRILFVPAAVRSAVYDLLHTEIGRLHGKARQAISAGRRRALDARADGLRKLADELAR
jgi:protein-L-isoaspartate O-methyltransferase